MPNKVLKSFAKKSGKSMKSLERMWKALDKTYEEDADLYTYSGYKNKYAFIVGVMKKNLHLNESKFDSALQRIVEDLDFN